MNVLLTDGTIGEVEGEVEVGDIVEVKLGDENGLTMYVEGEVLEIFYK
jgi:hypothetical protein